MALQRGHEAKRVNGQRNGLPNDRELDATEKVDCALISASEQRDALLLKCEFHPAFITHTHLDIFKSVHSLVMIIGNDDLLQLCARTVRERLARG